MVLGGLLVISYTTLFTLRTCSTCVAAVKVTQACAAYSELLSHSKVTKASHNPVADAPRADPTSNAPLTAIQKIMVECAGR